MFAGRVHRTRNDVGAYDSGVTVTLRGEEGEAIEILKCLLKLYN